MKFILSGRQCFRAGLWCTAENQAEPKAISTEDSSLVFKGWQQVNKEEFSFLPVLPHPQALPSLYLPLLQKYYLPKNVGFSCGGGPTRECQNMMSLDSTDFPGPEVLVQF